MLKPKHIGSLFAAILMVAIALGQTAAPVAAQDWSAPRTVWLSDAGHTVDGLFLDAWRADPEFLGQPISEELQMSVSLGTEPAKSRLVQFFENAALVYVPDTTKDAEWKVQTTQLGTETMQQDARKLRTLNIPSNGSCGSLDSGTCRRFGATGHTIRWGFKDYWESHGAERMLGLPISEEFVSDDGWTTQYFEQAVLRWKKDQDPTPRAIGQESATRNKVVTKSVSQPADVPIYDEALFQPPILIEAEADVDTGAGVGGEGIVGPGPQQGGYKEIVVSVSQQSMWAYENGELVISNLVSTGTGEVPETVTPVGYFSIHTKVDIQTMEGTISDEYYNVPDVPWVMYFDYLGNALHGTYWHSNFGTPMSHGCVNLPLDVAEYLYGWADIGTAVTVLG